MEKVHIYENTRATKIFEKNSKVYVNTEHGQIVADNAIIATHFPFNDSLFFSSTLTPITSYAIACEVEGKIPEGMYISAGGEEHSIRSVPHHGKELVIFLGETHRTGSLDNSTNYEKLYDFAKSIAKIKKVRYRWSTEDYDPPDEIPFIGRYPFKERIFFATGFKGWGMTHGTIAAMIISDMILGVDNKWAEVYDVNRIGLSTLKKMANQTLEAARSYSQRLLFSFSPNGKKELGLGEGKISLVEGEKVARYRDHEGNYHSISPICTHLGCTLSFNSAEKTWDCSCHGSRFNTHGKVIHGPATVDLKRKKELDNIDNSSTKARMKTKK